MIALSALEIDEYLETAIHYANPAMASELGAILRQLSALPPVVRRICRGAPVTPFHRPHNPGTTTLRFSCRDFDHWLDRMNVWEYWPYLRREMLLFHYNDNLAAITGPIGPLETVSKLNQLADELDDLINRGIHAGLHNPTDFLLNYTILALRSCGRLLAYGSSESMGMTSGSRNALLEAEIHSTHSCLKLLDNKAGLSVCDENMLFSEYVLNEKLRNLTGSEEVGVSGAIEVESDFLKWALPLLDDERPLQFKDQIVAESYCRAERDGHSASADEIAIDSSWKIHMVSSKSAVLENACASFTKRLKENFGVDIETCSVAPKNKNRQIILATAADDGFSDLDLINPKDYLIKQEDGNIIVCGKTDLGSMFGLFYLEYLFFMRGAMCLDRDLSLVRHSLFTTRMTMTSLGWMEWPDEYLELLPRYGIDAIYISPYANIRGGGRYRDLGHIQSPAKVKQLMERAKRWGLKIYCQFINQEEPGKKVDEERLLAEVLEEFPHIDGFILLTEGYVSNPEVISNFARKAHDLRPDLDIVVWNYNGAVVPENNKRKVEFARSCSVDTIQMLTWVKGAKATFDDEWRYVYDYSISVIGPSEVWAAPQLENEREKGATEIYARADAWNNWQFGTLPYLPFPQQWLERHDSLLANGITGTLDSWTYGFTPNFIAEMKNIYCWDNAPSHTEVLRQIAGREFGSAATDNVMKAWELFSEAIRMVPETGHGSLCNACAGPLFFDEPPERMWQSEAEAQKSRNTKYAVTVNARWPYVPQWALFYPDFSNRRNMAEVYVKSYLTYFEGGRHGTGEKGFSLKTFLKYLRLAAAKMEEGLLLYRDAVKTTLAGKREGAIRHVLIAEQIKNMLLSEAAILEFENCRYHLYQLPEEKNKLVERMVEILDDELARAHEFMAIIRKDSRIGFEWENDYFYTPHIVQEKINLLSDIRKRQIPDFLEANE